MSEALMARTLTPALLLIAALLSVCDGGDGDATPTADATETPEVARESATPVTAIGGPLQTSNRSNLSLCVDGAFGLEAADEKLDTVRDVVESVVEGLPVAVPEYADPEVVAGCPASQVLSGEPSEFSPFKGGSVQPWLGEAPSRHRFFIYFLPDGRYQEWFGDQPYATGSEESLVWVDMVLSGVTGGVYFAESAASDVLERALTDELLHPFRTPVPRPTIDWQACERGESPHPEHTCDAYWRQQTEEAARTPTPRSGTQADLVPRHAG
jgi:hypothetical protein